MVLRFTGDTWVQVKERGGEALLTKVMKAGETFPVPDRGNLVLNTGNAGRVEILVDGTEVPVDRRPRIGAQGCAAGPGPAQSGAGIPGFRAPLTPCPRHSRLVTI